MHQFKHFFKLISRNVGGLVIYGVITIVMVIMLVMQVKAQSGAMGVSTDTKSYAVSYVDNDNSPVSKGLIEYLGTINEVSDFGDKDETEISNIVFFYITDYHMTIPEGFGESVENGADNNDIEYETAAGSNGYVSYEIANEINSYLNAYRSFRTIGLDERAASDKAIKMLVNTSEVTIVSEEDKAVNMDMKEVVLFNINQYYPYLVLCLLAMGIGSTILITTKKELEERNYVSPVPTYMTKLTSMLGLFVSGTIIWALFMAFNLIYGAGTDILNNYFGVIAINSFLCMLTSCAITALLTSLIKSGTAILSMATNVIGLGMAFFCGVFVPMRMISEKVLSFAKFLPFYWTILVNNMTSVAQSKSFYDGGQMMVAFGIEFLFAIAISAIAIICSNKCIIKA